MSNSWTDEEQEQLRAAFNEHEPGTNGRINRSKLDELLVYVGQEPASDAALQELLRAHEDGANFDEFMDLMTQRAQQDDELSRGELLKAFEFFDKERKGFIPDAELRNVLRFLGNKVRRGRRLRVNLRLFVPRIVLPVTLPNRFCGTRAGTYTCLPPRPRCCS